MEYKKDNVVRRFPYCDYEFFPKEKWNHAFAAAGFTVQEHHVPGHPFSRNYPPITLKGRFVEVDWPMLENNPACIAPYHQKRKPLTPAAEKVLVPYACTVLRMTEMPLVNSED